MKRIFICILLISCNTFAKPSDKNNPERLYKKILKEFDHAEKIKIKDTISENPINTEVLIAKNKKDQIIGYIREVITTTGCNSACLPINATFFYNAKKEFFTVQSRQGLTKKDHQNFTSEDYQNLDFIILQNPKEFLPIKHPKEMVDALSGETLKQYEGVVIKEAAYTSLRLNLYNQDTISQLVGH